MSSTVPFKRKFSIVAGLIQIVFLIIYGIFVNYDEGAMPSTLGIKNNNVEKNNYLQRYFSFFQDIHAMVIFGIAFLLTFMKKYGYSGAGMNLFLAAISIQTALLVQNVWSAENGKIQISLVSLIWSDFAAASALIAFGAILGKVSPLQMVFFTIFETVCYAVNEHLCFKFLKVVDVGESVALHLFAALFGLSVALVVDWKKYTQDNKNESPSYISNLFCMIGTIFLWAFWPSFNSALSDADCQHRAVINTFLALIGSCVSAFILSSYLNGERKFEMTHIQNSTLAGGVSISGTANLLIYPTGALAIGSIAGILSVLGYKYLPDILAKKLKIYDPCGIHSLHAIPGLFGGLTGAALALTASEATYGQSLHTLYPAMVQVSNQTSVFQNEIVYTSLERSALAQAGFQLIYIAITIAASIITGLITGLVLRLPFFDPLEENEMFLDDVFWKVPEKEVDDNKNMKCNSANTKF